MHRKVSLQIMIPLDDDVKLFRLYDHSRENIENVLWPTE